MLSSLYPTLLKHFTHCLDLQELASSLSNVLHPGLRDTLVACGFGRHAKDLQSAAFQHNAATDFVRVTALLIQLVGSPYNSEKLSIIITS